MNNKPANRSHAFIKNEPGLGDDIPCSKCGAALDTGLECTECGWDMRPEIYPAKATSKAVESEQARDVVRYRLLRSCRGQEHDPPFAVQHEVDGILWGNDLDAAIDEIRAYGAPAGRALRWLTEKEVQAAIAGNESIQRKFCEVNGLPAPAGEGER